RDSFRRYRDKLPQKLIWASQLDVLICHPDATSPTALTRCLRLENERPSAAEAPFVPVAERLRGAGVNSAAAAETRPRSPDSQYGLWLDRFGDVSHITLAAIAPIRDHICLRH